MRAAVALLALLVGCSGGSSGSSSSTLPPQQLEFAGTWIGVYTAFRVRNLGDYPCEIRIEARHRDDVRATIMVDDHGTPVAIDVDGESVGDPGTMQVITLRGILGGELLRFDLAYYPASAAAPEVIVMEGRTDAAGFLRAVGEFRRP